MGEVDAGIVDVDVVIGEVDVVDVIVVGVEDTVTVVAGALVELVDVGEV